MAERVNPPPMVAFPQNNPFRPGTAENRFVGMLINALNDQRIVIEQLWRRVGKGDDLVSDAEVQQFFNFETSLSFADEDTNENISELRVISEQPEPLLVKEVNGGSYQTLENQWIKTTGDPTLFFPLYPGEGSRLRITNTDGGLVRLRGNGKTINGYSNGYIRRKNRSIDFEYDLEGWRAV